MKVIKMFMNEIQIFVCNKSFKVQLIVIKSCVLVYFSLGSVDLTLISQYKISNERILKRLQIASDPMFD